MKTNLLSSDKDPMGTAIADYFNHNKADKLRVFSSQFEEDEIPVNQLFRPYDEMPELEQIALQMAEGNILDVGAGSGCHVNPEKPDVPLNKNDAFQKVQKRRVQEKR